MKLLDNQPATLEELYSRAKKISGKIAVTFPFNDYLIGGKTKTCEPIRSLKIRRTKCGKYFVQFDKAFWEITKAKAIILKREGEKDYRSIRVAEIKFWQEV